jgi:hypothetical protein
MVRDTASQPNRAGERGNGQCDNDQLSLGQLRCALRADLSFNKEIKPREARTLID